MALKMAPNRASFDALDAAKSTLRVAHAANGVVTARTPASILDVAASVNDDDEEEDIISSFSSTPLATSNVRPKCRRLIATKRAEETPIVGRHVTSRHRAMRIISSNSLNRRRASLSAFAVASFPLVRGVARTVRLISSTALSRVRASAKERVARRACRINERAEASVMNEAKSR